MLENKQIIVISIALITVLLTTSTVFSNLDVLEAYAGITLSNDNVAKTIQVRVNPVGTNHFKTFDSFSRVGFVSGENNFLLESVPSIDKKPFYSLVKKSLETDNVHNPTYLMNISIDIFSGSGEVITLLNLRSFSTSC